MKRFIISLDEVEAALNERLAPLKKKGIDTHGLMAYGVHVARFGDFRTLVGYISKDLLEIHPELLEDPQNFQRTLYSCVDVVEAIAQTLIPYLERVCGRCDHTLQFDRFIGNDAIVSLNEPFPTLSS